MALRRCPAEDGYDGRSCDVVLSPIMSTVRDFVPRALAEMGLLASIPVESTVVWKSYKEVSEVRGFTPFPFSFLLLYAYSSRMNGCGRLRTLCRVLDVI